VRPINLVIFQGSLSAQGGMQHSSSGELPA